MLTRLKTYAVQTFKRVTAGKEYTYRHISLPPEWCRNNAVEVGDYVQIYQDSERPDRIVVEIRKGTNEGV